jgi:hypothetical protein
MSCFQCDLDIGHVCYAGQPRARWGWTDEAVSSLEAAQRALSTPPLPVLSVQESAPPKQQARRRSSKSKRRVP